MQMFRGEEEARMLQEMKSLNGKEGLINLLYLSKLLEIQALQELLKFRRNMELLKVRI